jgi:hypothetical protein
VCEVFTTNIFFFVLTPKEEVDNSFFVLWAMQQQFERLNLVLEEVKDRMDQQEVVIRNLQGG